MKTPELISSQEFINQRAAWVKEKSTLINDTLCCSACETEIAFVLAYISIHDVRFGGCAGFGAVWRLPIPYCPQCEQKPEESGCFHEAPSPESRVARFN